MRLIHFTDPHLSSLASFRFGQMRGKRRSGFLSWIRKRQWIHRREVLDQLTAAVIREQADRILLTGDLVQIGLAEEIRQAADWLQQLQQTQQVFFVPGNHDVYAADSWPAMRTHWGELLPPAAVHDHPLAGYPVQQQLADVQLLGASSACVTPVFSARGQLGDEQLKRLRSMLKQCRQDQQLPFMCIHHPPLPGMTKWRKALKETGAVKSLLERHPPAVVLCGHLHDNHEQTRGPTRVFCTASASSRQQASYRVFDIEADHQGSRPAWKLSMQLKTLAPTGRDFHIAGQQSWRYAY